jgi:hypothetical protein
MAFMSEACRTGLSFPLCARIPHVPYVVSRWRREHPGEGIPTGISSPSPGPPGRTAAGVIRSSTTSTGPTRHAARCTVRGIDEQISSAEKAVAGPAPVKRNRFLQLSGGTRTR